MNFQQLRDELIALGENPGPITPTTEQVYLRQLKRLQKATENKKEKKGSTEKKQASDVQSPKNVNYSRKLVTSTQSFSWSGDHNKTGHHFDCVFATYFTQPDSNEPWREGHSRRSFNYLLMDPRITRAIHDQEKGEQFKSFVSSIFYVGKGNQTRPHKHLKDAKKLCNQSSLRVSPKEQRILEIWKAGFGVVTIHIFQNSLPVEAFCREAAMIDAIDINNLTNLRRGDYYGICKTWTDSERQQWGFHLGFHLLERSFNIYLNEGEQQIRPTDL